MSVFGHGQEDGGRAVSTRSMTDTGQAVPEFEERFRVGAKKHGSL